MAILTVGTGGTYATLAAAQTAAVAGVDSLKLVSDITENFTLSKNIVEIYSDNGSRILNSTNASSTFLIGSSLTSSITIRDMQIKKTAGNAQPIIWTSIGAGSQLIFLRCKLAGERTTGSGSNDVFGLTGALTTTDQLIINRCELVGNTKTTTVVAITGTTVAGTVLIKNNIFRNITSGNSTGLYCNNLNSSKVIKSYHNLFLNLNTGTYMDGAMDIINCQYLGNSIDVSINNGAAKTNFLNCLFGTQTNTGGWDSSIIFGAVTANELVNAASGDYNLKAFASSIDAGLTIASITDDYNGAVRPRGNSQTYDIGPTEYQKFYII